MTFCLNSQQVFCLSSLPAQFGATDPAFARGDIVNDVKCLQKGKLAPVEQGPRLRRLQVVAFAALPVILLDATAIVPVATLLATAPLLPFQGG